MNARSIFNDVSIRIFGKRLRIHGATITLVQVGENILLKIWRILELAPL